MLTARLPARVYLARERRSAASIRTGLFPPSSIGRLALGTGLVPSSHRNKAVILPRHYGHEGRGRRASSRSRAVGVNDRNGQLLMGSAIGEADDRRGEWGALGPPLRARSALSPPAARPAAGRSGGTEQQRKGPSGRLQAGRLMQGVGGMSRAGGARQNRVREVARRPPFYPATTGR